MSVPEKWINGAGKNVFHSPDMRSANPESREDSIRKDLTFRLKHTCEHLTRLDFEALVLKMTHEQLRGEGILGRRIRPC
jgi:hypothetical protein